MARRRGRFSSGLDSFSSGMEELKPQKTRANHSLPPPHPTQLSKKYALGTLKLIFLTPEF